MENPQSEGIPVEQNSSQQPFYNEFSQINDPKAAEDVAYVEKNMGRDAAIVRADALQREHDTDLTERERENLEIANMLAEEFPNAFVRSVDRNGDEIFGTGLDVVRYDEVLSKIPLLTPERKELSEEYVSITSKLRMFRPTDGKKFLNALVDTPKSVYISRYGMAFGLEGRFDIANNQDSIKAFSEDELKFFFRILKFLDKVGETGKEIAMEEERKNMSVEDYRNLARQIKNTPNS